jgi:hypothetical protein
LNISGAFVVAVIDGGFTRGSVAFPEIAEVSSGRDGDSYMVKTEQNKRYVSNTVITAQLYRVIYLFYSAHQ